jgi:hypothetical protein
MYGIYDYTFQYVSDNISAGIEKENDLYHYHRKIPGEKSVEKIIMSNSGAIIVNPVEPLNLPHEVTNFLEIKFDPIFIEPYSEKEIFLLFPLEIGVFIKAKKDIEVLDIFSLVKQKYSLYGSPSEGIITRWAFSEIFPSIPEVDHNEQGILKLIITNSTKEWVEVTRVVFEGSGMKIYYGDVVSMIGRMKILSKKIAETEFIDQPLQVDQEKSIELYSARDIPVVKRSYTMEWGLI